MAEEARQTNSMEHMVRKKTNHSIDSKQMVATILQCRRRRAETKREAETLAGKIVLITGCLFLITAYVFGIGFVDGEGMYPRLRDGDLVLFYRLEAEQNIGDVVAYFCNNELRYGRIVAMGGDIVDMNEGGQLIVNGSVQQEEIFFATNAEGRTTRFPIALAEEEVFVLGDNRTYALDSRDFGPIAKEDIRGKVITLLRNRRL
jgi:signal peptidase I